MRTSYFNRYFGKDGVSIARYSPKWFRGKKYSDLAPPAWLIGMYIGGKVGEAEYKVLYYQYVLIRLDPATVYADLKDSVILCHESTGFCHRFLIAEWLMDELGVVVTEVDVL